MIQVFLEKDHRLVAPREEVNLLADRHCPFVE